MTKSDDKQFPDKYVITCDEHGEVFEFEAADNREQAKEAFYIHIGQGQGNYDPGSKCRDCSTGANVAAT